MFVLVKEAVPSRASNEIYIYLRKRQTFNDSLDRQGHSTSTVKIVIDHAHAQASPLSLLGAKS